MSKSKITNEIVVEDKTKTGIESAKNNFKRLDSDIKSMSKSLDFLSKSFMVGLAGKALSSVVSFSMDSVKAFAQVEKAQIKLDYALKQVGGNTTKVTDFINDLARVSSASATDLTVLASEIAGLGKGEKDIKLLMTAANNLAEATGTNVTEAFKKLQGTYTGSVDELGKLIPELRTLTKEQLASGEALDLVNKKFEDFNRTVMDSTSQKLKNFTDTMSTLKETAGEGLALAFSPFISALDKIINKQVDVMKRWNELKKAFNDVEKNGTDAAINSQVKVFEERLRIARESLAALDKVKGRIAEEDRLKAIKMRQEEISLLEAELKNLRREVAVIQSAENNPKPVTPKVTPTTGTGTKDDTKDAFLAILDSALSQANKIYYDSLDESGKLVEDYLKEIEPLVTAMNDAKFGSLPDDIRNDIVEALNIANEKYMKSIVQDTPATPGVTESSSGTMNLLGDMNPLSLLMHAISPLIDMFSSLASVKMILDPLQVVFTAIFDVLSPIIDSLLRPLIGIFRIIGETIGKVLAPILMRLSPIIELISKAFVFLYNYAIKPLANTIIWVISTIYNMVANLVNSVIRALNKIPFVNIKWRMTTMDYESMKLPDISTSDLDSAGGRAGVDSVGGSGGAASYSGSRDVTVNVYIDRSMIADTRDIALVIGRELKLAESYGYN